MTSRPTEFRLPPFPQLASSEGFALRKLSGGLNHTVFAIETEGQVYCLKVFTDAARNQAARECWALKALESSGIAPRPFAYVPAHEDAPCGAILMEYIEGRPLSSFPDIEALVFSRLLPALAAMRQTELDVRSIPWVAIGQTTGSLDDWAANSIAAYNKVRAFVGQSLGEMEDELLDAIVTQLPVFVGKLESMRTAYSLCRGDPNLANVIVQPDGRLRLLDWEYSGYGDAAYEYADCIHHPSGDAISRDAWLKGVGAYAAALNDADFANRFRIYDVLLDAWWCLRLARAILEVVGGIESRALKADPSLLAANRLRLKRRLERAVSRLSGAD